MKLMRFRPDLEEHGGVTDCTWCIDDAFNEGRECIEKNGI